MQRWPCYIVCALALTGCGGSETEVEKNEFRVSEKGIRYERMKPLGLDREVRRLLAKMTLAEKVGQMTQVTLEAVAEDDEQGNAVLDEEKLRTAILTHHVGSILNCGGQARTVDNWRAIITTLQDLATQETRLAIPILYGIDSVHGANYVRGATIFPQNIAMAATGNIDLVKASAEVTALETRAAGIPWNFNPVLGLARQPLWSRHFETYGEDAYVVSVLGAATIEGSQGSALSDSRRVAACMKHYLGYSVPRSGQDRTPAAISDRELRELFLKPFAAAVRANVATVMVNSSEINGLPVHASPYYLRTILREELGFKGFVVSDWKDIMNLYEREKVAASQREAVKMAVMAGIDMSMVPYDYDFCRHLIDLVEKEEVPMARIDQAVGAILRVKFRLGLFERPYPDPDLVESFAAASAQRLNLRAARECLTLLKNEQSRLPLAKTARVLVTGPGADLLSTMNGGRTLTRQGDQESLYPQEKDTILEAIQKKLGSDHVKYAPGVGFDSVKDLNAVLHLAAEVDVIIACLGEPSYCETPGNITDLTLSEPQRTLIGVLAETEKPIVVVLTQGRPRIVRDIVDQAQAILLAYLPGMEGGTAIADALFGDVNPSGKLPFTYPKHTGMFTPYDHKHSEEAPPNRFDPQWPFGHGLSYTRFAYRGLNADRFEFKQTESVTVTVEVTNVGERRGQEIVQLFLSDQVATVTPPVRRLRGFQKIELRPGQSEIVKFLLRPEAFSFIGVENAPVWEPGDFDLHVGDLSQTITLVADPEGTAKR